MFLELLGCPFFSQRSSEDEHWKEAEGVPLPSSDVSYNAGLPIAIEAFNINGDIIHTNQTQTSQNSPQPSMMAEIMKLYGLW